MTIASLEKLLNVLGDETRSDLAQLESEQSLMARRGRIYIAGLSVHVITRGHNHISIFECEEDYEVFLMFLVRAAARHGGSVHAFVLMTNHIHLMVTPRGRCPCVAW